MYKNLIKISTLGMSREDWLAERKKSLGGSDVAALLGLNEYCSPYSLYAEKLGLLPEKEETEAMRIGKDLEEYVAKRFAEKTGKKVRKENAIIRNPDMPYLHANVDRVVVGENAVLECKTVSALSLQQYKNGEYPARFYAQCCAYMLVCGFDKAYLAVLVLGREFLIFEIERDESELTALDNACRSFWNDNVLKKEAPGFDGSDATKEALKTIFAESAPGHTADLTAVSTHLSTYLQLKKRMKELEEELNLQQAYITEFMADAEKGSFGNISVSFETQSRSTFDRELYELENGAIADKYFKVSTQRPFKVTEKKGK